ncbi:hypothetical protein KJ605_02295, partial [Patescibacteria group bacterium]|nr:hypothetical protein [Patescibacteria group bacterium]MBU1970583.1 hypothetical protein [Patescibacteria group bacterium]
MTKDFLQIPVRFLTKVGPKYEKMLERLEIKTIGDLLYHLPFRYEDYSKQVTVNEAEVNEVVSIRGWLGKVTNVTT